MRVALTYFGRPWQKPQAAVIDTDGGMWRLTSQHYDWLRCMWKLTWELQEGVPTFKHDHRGLSHPVRNCICSCCLTVRGARS